MSDMLFALKSFLDAANRGEASLSEASLQNIADGIKDALNRQFNQKRSGKFSLRMSNVGRPVCQLEKEKEGLTPEPDSYNHKLKMVIGDIVDVIVPELLKAAGVKVDSVQEKVRLTINMKDGTKFDIDGTLDIIIDGKVYDVKSASKFAFETKFSATNGFAKLKEEDAFGYLPQLFGYAEALGKKAGGWIAVNKETGEVAVLEVPEEDYEESRKDALRTILSTVRTLESGEKVHRCFDDKPEVHYKKPTGNRVLDTVCNFCSYKHHCWTGLQYKRVRDTKNFTYYTHFEEKENDSDAV